MACVVDIFEAAVRRGASSGQTVLDLLDRGESVFAALEDEQPAFFGLALGPITYFTRPKRGCDKPATALLA